MKTERINFGKFGRKVFLLAFLFTIPVSGFAAGTLTAVGSTESPIAIRDHHLDVTIHPGFAKVEVTQTFFNPNQTDIEGIYAFPVPASASLSEFSVHDDERELLGEVVAKKTANEIYEEEKNKGNDAGVANKETFQRFEFKISRIPAQAESRMRFVYYQPIKIDSGVGRFVYPLQEGGTDERAVSFWTANPVVEHNFSANFDVRLGYAIEELRIPGFEGSTVVEEVQEGHKRARVNVEGASLENDLVLYYRLAADLPARLELITYKESKDSPGTFMLVNTPGVELQSLKGTGADYTFILDVSGSMKGKLRTLISGVKQALASLSASDRFRIVTFSTGAHDLTGGFLSADKLNVSESISKLDRLQANGGTNMFAAFQHALNKVDDDRVTTIILVTDAVTNTGVIDPSQFERLLKQYDIRFFGFLLGNSANWPLMRILSETTGGYYAGVSNSDDIIGQILLAKSKITYEALHDARLRVRGIKTDALTDKYLGKIYRGEQLVIFGRYENGGKATIELATALSGEDKSYTTTVEFPEVSTDHPELERLWAMQQIEIIEKERDLGREEESEANSAIESLGVEYQLVTDRTSMLLLSDEKFSEYGISRRNKERVAREATAFQERRAAPARNYRVDQAQPMYPSAPGSTRLSENAFHITQGGGAVDPLTGGAALLIAGALGARLRRRREEEVVAGDNT